MVRGRKGADGVVDENYKWRANIGLSISSLTWTYFLHSEHLSQCSVTTQSACLQIVAPLEAEKHRKKSLSSSGHVNKTNSE